MLINPKAKICILPDSQSACREAAERFMCNAVACVAECGAFSAAFSGGSTPRRMLEYLADPEYSMLIPWRYIVLFQADERFVPTDNTESNSRMLHETLWNKVPINENSIHAFPVHLPFEDSAAVYNDELTQNLGTPPFIDLVLLGVGSDGHTASLFPGSEALNIEDKYAAACSVDAEIPQRLTLTRPTLRNAGRVVFLVTGESKAEIVARCLSSSEPDMPLPARTVSQECRNVLWILDEASASLIRE